MEPAGQRARMGQALVVLVCLVLVVLVGRLFYINVALAQDLREWSYPRQTSTVILPGRRGAILDRRYRVLAGSHDHYTIFADPRFVLDREEACRQLAGALGMPAADIRKRLENPTSPAYVIIREDVPEEQVKQVRQLELSGFDIQRQPGRTYPMGSLAAHVLGCVGKDGRGLEGVELVLDEFLRAKPGRRIVYRDVSRRALFQEEGSYVAPKDGLHAILTIDAAIQEKLEEQLRERVTFHNADSAVGLVMDPRTGEVLAMANYPTFEPARAGEFKPEIRRNRILTDPVEPGSVFKPYVMAPVLAERLARPTETVFCKNGLYIVGKRQLHDHHQYGDLTVEEIMAKSSNIGMAILGQRLGNEKMYHALRAFGYGRLTGIDLPGEGEGLLMPLKDWRPYSTISVPMGHELAVTPIQIMTAFNSIVNGGRLMKPRVVAAVIGDDGEMIEDRTQPVERGRSLDEETAQQMVTILCKVVSEGTGKACQLDRWQVLGKTGTAQIPRIGQGRRGYEPGAYLASFIAAAPAHDPQVSVLVMVRRPRKNNYYGSVVALPAVKQILEFTLPYLNVPEEKVAPAGGAQLVWDARD